MDNICQKLLLTYNSGLAVSQSFKGIDGKYHYLFLSLENEDNYQVGIKSCTELKFSSQEHILMFFKTYQDGLKEQVKALSFLNEEREEELITQDLLSSGEDISALEKEDIPFLSAPLSLKRVPHRQIAVVKDSDFSSSVNVFAKDLYATLKKGGYLFGGSSIKLHKDGYRALRIQKIVDSNRFEKTKIILEKFKDGWKCC
jgi:hypothetical protein